MLNENKRTGYKIIIQLSLRNLVNTVIGSLYDYQNKPEYKTKYDYRTTTIASPSLTALVARKALLYCYATAKSLRDARNLSIWQ